MPELTPEQLREIRERGQQAIRMETPAGLYPGDIPSLFSHIDALQARLGAAERVCEALDKDSDHGVKWAGTVCAVCDALAEWQASRG